MGNDTYVLRKGSGVDRISDYDWTAGNTDTVVFEDVSSTEVRALERRGSDLVISYGESDTVRVESYFSDASYRVERFQFADGVSWGDAAIKARVQTLGDAASNWIGGYSDGSNRMYGFGGNDNLSGGALADLIDGGDGNDTLSGGLGADRFVFSTVLGTSNVDVVTDFKLTEGDRFVLHGDVFAQLNEKTSLDGMFRHLTQAADGNDFIVYDKSSGKLYYDQSGQGSGMVEFATLSNRPQDLVPGAFVIV